MRWLLVAALLFLPVAGGCGGGASPVGDESLEEEPVQKYRCEKCSSTSATQDTCHDQPMVPI